MTHVLKIYPQYFKAIAIKAKTFEFIKQDRIYKIGDILILKEWDPDADQFMGRYTGQELSAEVTYILRLNDFDLPNYVVMSIKLQPEAGEEK